MTFRAGHVLASLFPRWGPGSVAQPGEGSPDPEPGPPASPHPTPLHKPDGSATLR